MQVIHCAVGAISGRRHAGHHLSTIIVGFNVRPDNNGQGGHRPQQRGYAHVRRHHDCINEIETAMKGMLAPSSEWAGPGRGAHVFRITGVGVVAGCYVRAADAARRPDAPAADNIVIYDGAIASSSASRTA